MNLMTALNAVALGATLQAAHAGSTGPAEERLASVRDIPELGLGTWLSDRDKVNRRTVDRKYHVVVVNEMGWVGLSRSGVRARLWL